MKDQVESKLETGWFTKHYNYLQLKRVTTTKKRVTKIYKTARLDPNPKLSQAEAIIFKANTQWSTIMPDNESVRITVLSYTATRSRILCCCSRLSAAYFFFFMFIFFYFLYFILFYFFFLVNFVIH